MKKLFTLLLVSCSVSAHADCYMRSDINLSKMDVRGQPTDIQKIVMPDEAGKKCVIRYRIYADNEWRTVEGTGTGSTEKESCGKAMDIKKAYSLIEITPGIIHAENQLVCSDLLDIYVRPVRRGDLIWESETDMHSDLGERGKYFFYKQARCRKFIERTARDQNLIIYQGIICQNDTGSNSKWRVIDKY